MAGLDQELNDLRKRIDVLDKQIVRLLNQRTGCAMAIGRIKHQRGDAVFTPEREREVVERVTAASAGPLRATELRAIYREIMSAAVAFEGGLMVGVLRADGAAGAWMARHRFGEGTVVRAFASAKALAQALARGRIRLALISSAQRKSLARGLGVRDCGSLRLPGQAGSFVLLMAEKAT